MTEPTQHGGETPLYPIREVSRLTGVNSVTLRAWERRYGLIKPRRTPKGHRLYAREDIERVEQILQWLNRGVPVSQVRELLDRPDIAEAESPPPDPGDWPAQRSRLVGAVEALDLARLDTLYAESLALYPVTTCVVELWAPALRDLEERWGERLGDELQRRTLESFLRTRIGMRLYHGNARATGPTLLAMPLPDDPGTLWLLLAALVASDRGLARAAARHRAAAGRAAPGSGAPERQRRAAGRQPRRTHRPDPPPAAAPVRTARGAPGAVRPGGTHPPGRARRQRRGGAG